MAASAQRGQIVLEFVIGVFIMFLFVLATIEISERTRIEKLKHEFGISKQERGVYEKPIFKILKKRR